MGNKIMEREKRFFYFCVISASVIGSYIETTISCSPSNTSLTNLTWRFNQSQTILTKTGSDGNHTVSERWKQHVKDVSESGSLTLQDLSSDQEGTYTCELSDAEETIITHIFVRINEGNSSSTKRIIGWVLAVVLVGAGGAGLVLYCIKKRGQRENSRRSTFDENILKLTADGLEVHHHPSYENIKVDINIRQETADCLSDKRRS
ncbi:uncharacterized protein LOC115799931 [Archocentrus centrarchus]|uniref:uncharacterized protein LOC115799931 n=1 Tax=Archocentrus centrarchus TaxID=63155 RepID=UPI0011E9D22A|nr:uncharacterized protein LOC115799931 [Archocentrus centrarchus]